MSLYQRKMFYWSNFIKQAVTLSKELVPLEYFYQTRCLGVFILLIGALRKPVTILGELVPHETFSQTSRIIPSINFFKYRYRFQDEREILTAFAVFRFMISLAFYGCSFFLWNIP